MLGAPGTPIQGVRYGYATYIRAGLSDTGKRDGNALNG